MADETFPIQSASGGLTSGRLQGAVQLDLSELENKLGTPLVDPATKWGEGDASRPHVAKPTVGPHHYTIYVPHDEGARVNIGAAAPNNSDPGISLDTKTHFHAHTFGADQQTYLSLGTTTLAKAFSVNLQTTGYAMCTVGASNHWAMGDVSLVSLKKTVAIYGADDVHIGANLGSTLVTGKVAVNASSDGNVQISAGTDHDVNTNFWTVAQAVGLTAIDVADFAAPGIGYFNEGAGKAVGGAVSPANLVGGFATADAKALHDYIIVKSSGVVDKVLGHLEATAGIVLAFKKTRKEAKDRKTGFQSVKAWGTWAASVGAELYAIYKDIANVKKAETGQVKITAKGNAVLAANGSVAIAGVMGATLSGFKSASVNGLSVSMKGHKSASVWGGLGASLKSLAGDVAMSSDLKGASIGAKKDVKVASETGKVSVTGDNAVQFNSVSNEAFVHGMTGAYIGAGKGQGFGVVAKPKNLSLGTLSNAETFSGAATDGTYTVMRFTDKIIQLQSGSDSKAILRTSAFEVNTKAVTLKASGDVTIKGSKVLIG